MHPICCNEIKTFCFWRLPPYWPGTWENGVNQLWEKVIKPSGFKVERVARVPYISEGDQRHGAYILDDAVFVLSVPPESHAAAALPSPWPYSQ